MLLILFSSIAWGQTAIVVSGSWADGGGDKVFANADSANTLDGKITSVSDIGGLIAALISISPLNAGLAPTATIDSVTAGIYGSADPLTNIAMDIDLNTRHGSYTGGGYIGVTSSYYEVGIDSESSTWTTPPTIHDLDSANMTITFSGNGTIGTLRIDYAFIRVVYTDVTPSGKIRRFRVTIGLIDKMSAVKIHD